MIKNVCIIFMSTRNYFRVPRIGIFRESFQIFHVACNYNFQVILKLQRRFHKKSIFKSQSLRKVWKENK